MARPLDFHFPGKNSSVTDITDPCKVPTAVLTHNFYITMQTVNDITNQRGFTLVEVMVALVIFTISLLGLAGLQAAALRDNHLANQNTIATQLAEDMAERIRANPPGISNGDYSAISVQPGEQDCYGGSCTSGQIAQMDAYQWFAAIQSTLPSGTGTVTASGSQFTITVMWDQERTGATGTNCSGNYNIDLKCLTFTVQP